MNALMNIMVRVATANAAKEIRQLESELARLERQVSSANARSNGLGAGGVAGISKWGNQVQWAGRQLQYNFTLPLVIAGGAATKFALDNEKAFVRVQKVYGDTSMSAAQIKSETDALAKSFRVLSDEFGVNQAETINIAADWAAAGASGVALAKSTKLTLEAMILGELDAAKATESLIAIQAQYGQTVEELSATIDVLNMVENQTGVSLGGLIDGFARAAGVARSAGVDVRHLAAMIAAMSPAAGTAAQAGNAIKTILSRLLSPTREAAQVMGLMGINVKELSWQNLNGSQRLETMAKSFNGLDDAQKAVVSSVVASRWQINKFDVLMRDMTNTNGYYQKSLNSTQSAQDNFNQRVRELNAVLSSNPQKLKQVWTILQNTAADIVIPLIPYILALANGIRVLVQQFQELDPAVQKLALAGLVVLAAIGPIARYAGSVATLIGILGSGFLAVSTRAAIMGKALISLGMAPFQTLAAGIGSLIGGISSLGAMAAAGVGKGTPLVVAAFTRMWSIVTVNFAAFRATMGTAWLAFMYGQLLGSVFSFSGRMGAAWSLVYSSILRAYIIGQTALLRVWTVFMQSGLVASVVRFGGIISSVWAAAMIGIRNVIATSQAAIAATWTVGNMSLVGITAAMRTGLIAIWSSIALEARVFASVAASAYGLIEAAAIASIGSAVGILSSFKNIPAIMGALWSRVYTAILQAYVVGQAILLRSWTVFLQSGFVGTLTRFSGIINGTWVAVMIGIRNVIAASQAAIAAVWFAGSTGLVGITVAMRTALLAVWTTIAVESRVLASVIASSYALAGSASTFLVAGATSALAFLRTLPALVVGFFASILPRVIAILGAIPAIFARIGPMLARIGPTIWTGLLSGGRLLLVGMTSWVGLAVAAALGIAYAFRKQIAAVWTSIAQDMGNLPVYIANNFAPLVTFFQSASNAIQGAFWQLPAGVRDALLSVVAIVQSAAMQVYDLFSYLNPWAHHSPSLVESVTTGMSAVKAQYASVRNTGGIFGKAARDLAVFKRIAASVGGGQFTDERTNVAKGIPAQLRLFDTLIGDLRKMNQVLASQESSVNRQQAVVDKWKNRLDAANKALDVQQRRLDVTQKTLDRLNNAYSSHQDRLTNFANAPIKGMKAMQDQIFANDMAQKKLRLGILNWEQANGTVDGLRDKMAKLQGSIETLSGQRSDLRMAGAGSDILGPISGQIDAMQKQYKAIQKTADSSPVDKMKAELAKLESQGQVLDLQYSINFDPLTRQIDQLANGMKELSFKDIIDGIMREKAEMAKLTPQVEAANKAVEKQQAVVDAATSARDKVSSTYDAESAKLNALEDAYRKTADAVRSLEEALRSLGGAGGDAIRAAKEAKPKKPKKEYLTPGAQNFKDAAGGNFPDVGGQAKIGREGPKGDQSKLIDAWTKSEYDSLGKQFASFDMFKPIRDMWNKTWAWVKAKVNPLVQPVIKFVKDLFKGGFTGIFDGLEIPPSVSRAWNSLVGFATSAVNGVMRALGFLAPEARKIFDAVVNAGKRVWNEIGPELAKFGDLGRPLANIWRAFLAVLKVVGAVVGGVFVAALKIAAGVISGALGPALDIVIDLLKFVVIAVRETVKLVGSILGGDWSDAWDAATALVENANKTILSIFKNFGRLVWGALKGGITAIIDIFKYLYDVLVGHSIVPDMIDAIVNLFKGLWGNIRGYVSRFVSGVIDFFKQLPGDVYNAVKSMKDRIGDAANAAFNYFVDRVSTGAKRVISYIRDIPGDAWNALKDFKSKLVDIASNAFISFYDTQVRGWTRVAGWLAKIPQAAWNALSNLRERLGNIATAGWNMLESAWGTGWASVSKWLSGRAQAIWNALSNIRERIGNIATAGWNSLETAWATGWKATSLWLSGLGQRIWDNLSGKAGVSAKIKDVATAGWNSLETAWATGWKATSLWLVGLGQRIWDNLSGKAGVGAKIRDVAVNGWNMLETAWASGWAATSLWLQNLGQRIWDNLSGKAGVGAKIKNVAVSAWDELESAFGSGWAGFKIWLGALPGRMVAQITGKNGMGARLADAASDAFNVLKTVASNVVDGKNGFMSWVRDLPGRVAAAMAGIGSSVANATKGAWNGAANWINTNGIKNINRITSKLGFNMDNLPTFSRGGIVPGGHSKTDNVLAGLRSGEGVLVPEAVKAIGGRRGLEGLNRAAESGRVANNGYTEPVSRNAGMGMGDGIGDKFKAALGGVGNLAGDVSNWMRDGLGSAMDKLMTPLVEFAHQNLGYNLVGRVGTGFLAQVKDDLIKFVKGGEQEAGSGTLGGMGFQRQMAVLRAAFPGITMNSGFRPGAITTSGRQSYHALGRAVDIPPRMEYFDWILKNYGKTSKELIFSPAGNRQIHNGQPHMYTGAVKAMHYNHVHWAYDDGGWLMPGVTQTVNRTGQPEPVFNPAQWTTLKSIAAGASRALESGMAGGPGNARGVGASVTVERALVNITTATVTSPIPATNNTTYNFYGDISLPNIKNGDDAEEFLLNLQNLAGT